MLDLLLFMIWGFIVFGSTLFYFMGKLSIREMLLTNKEERENQAVKSQTDKHTKEQAKVCNRA